MFEVSMRQLMFAIGILAAVLSPPVAAWATPTNDAFANAIVLSIASGQTTGANVEATKEAGEPVHAGNSGGTSVWWWWTAPANGGVNIDTFGSGFDTLLAVYTGNWVSSLTLVAGNDDYYPSHGQQSRVGFCATAGTTYRIAVDGYNQGTGSIVLHWSLAAVAPNDNFANASVISGFTGSLELTASNGCASKEPGEPNHAVNPGGTSLWWQWTPTANTPVTIDTLGSDFDTLLAVYTGSSVGALTQIAANDDFVGQRSLVGFTAAAGTTYRIAVDGYAADRGKVVLRMHGLTDIAATKRLPDITGVCIGPMTVAAAVPGTSDFYVESGISGIRVSASPQPSVGDQALIFGAVTTTDGERCIIAQPLDSISHGNPPANPLGMPLRSLGGGDWNYDPATGTGQCGVTGGIGLNNIGLLVRVWGRVTEHDTAVPPAWFAIDDGLGLPVRVYCDYVDPSWQYAIVTGASSCEQVSGETRRVIRAGHVDVSW